MKKFRKACGRILFPHEGKESFTIYNVKNVQNCSCRLNNNDGEPKL